MTEMAAVGIQHTHPQRARWRIWFLHFDA